MDNGYSTENLIVPLIAMITAALVFFIYHLIAICLWGNHIRMDQNHQQQSLQAAAATLSHNHGISYPLAHLIPIHKYHKKGKVDGDEEGDDNSTCAVCLGDFEEGEELRTLPECMHCFHVPCIDMWLYSHTTCPICRANAIMLQHDANYYAHNHLNPHHSINIMQNTTLRPS
ncbi:hypothetical protein Lal_00007354 [Lupinus albus]|uniref:Putative transcription factor C2H2 family n=1 Tax=Lupinus albus TaxID=3870 RepID=A0A6A5MU64_LUPAL|nr:putative transcription factor C2H2 family [Lupinus albus]KAF1874740.1 hypothetical protein Lal_00007354 [Lupinus albus]